MSDKYEFVEIPTLEKEVDRLMPLSKRKALMEQYPGHENYSERFRNVCKFIRAKNATVKLRAGLLAYASGGNPDGALCVSTMRKFWSKTDPDFPKDIQLERGKRKVSPQENSEFLQKLLED